MDVSYDQMLGGCGTDRRRFVSAEHEVRLLRHLPQPHGAIRAAADRPALVEAVHRLHAVLVAEERLDVAHLAQVPVLCVRLEGEESLIRAI